MNKLYLLALGILASLLMVCSCTSDEESTNVDPDDQTTTDPNEQDEPDEPSTESTSTSVSFTGSVSDTDFVFSDGDAISVCAYNETYDALGDSFASSVQYTYASSAFTSTSPIKFTDEDGELSYIAVYPYMEIPADNAITFTVEPDQSSQSNYRSSDLMVGTASATTSATPALTFSRLLSNIVIEIESADFEVSSATATLSAVASVDYNISTLGSSASGSASSISMLNSGNDFMAIAAPQSFSAGTTIATIVVDGESYPVVLESEITLGAGLEVTIPISISTFDGTITYGTPIINDWYNSTFDKDESDEDVDDGVAATISIADLKSPYSLYYSDMGGSRTIAIISNKSQISYSYDTSATWLTVGNVGEFSTLMTLVIEPNYGDEREAVITITAGPEGNQATTELTITQGEEGSSSSNTVGDLVYDEDGNANGIICYVSEDGTQIMALSFEVAYVKWASTSLDSDGLDIALPDMYSNTGIGYADDCMEYMLGLDHYSADYYPLFAWAESLGDGWYIPTRSDWESCIMPAFVGTQTDSDGNYMLITDLNDTMVAAGGTSYDNNDYTGVRYWTCNLADANAGSKVYITKLCGNNLTKNSAKTSGTPYARAVKYVAM